MLIHLNLRKFSFRQVALTRAAPGDVLHLNRLRAGVLAWWNRRARALKWDVCAERVSVWVSWVLLCLIAGCATWWVMRIAQVPFPSAVSTNGVVFYESTSGQTMRSLFGEKGFDTSRLVLRGVVITGNDGGVNQGMALIEVDGKQTEAITIGEMVPPGVRLEKIEPDKVTVSYQGRELNLQQ